MLPFEGTAAQGTASVRRQQETEGTLWETGMLDKEAIYKGVAACREVTIPGWGQDPQAGRGERRVWLRVPDGSEPH